MKIKVINSFRDKNTKEIHQSARYWRFPTSEVQR